jgi:hypothetical protein
MYVVNPYGQPAWVMQFTPDADFDDQFVVVTQKHKNPPPKPKAGAHCWSQGGFFFGNPAVLLVRTRGFASPGCLILISDFRRKKQSEKTLNLHEFREKFFFFGLLFRFSVWRLTENPRRPFPGCPAPALALFCGHAFFRGA